LAWSVNISSTWLLHAEEVSLLYIVNKSVSK